MLQFSRIYISPNRGRMSFARNYRSQGGTCYDDRWTSFNGNNFNHRNRNVDVNRSSNYNWNHINFHDFSLGKFRDHDNGYANPPNAEPAFKRRKISVDTWGYGGGRHYPQYNAYECADQSTYNNSAPPPTRSNAENLGLRLELPQTTIGTAMVLCHRFFVRRSHACHDRFLIAVAALFLAAKSEETPRPLNNVVRASSEIFHKQDITLLSYLLPVDWFEQYQERVVEAEQMILTTLNFELNVQHPYGPLASVLNKLGLSQTVLVNLALNLVSEGYDGLSVYRWTGLCINPNESEVVGDSLYLGHGKVYTRFNVLTCMILLAGGLICCAWKVF
ncbi:CYCLIN-T1-4-LIKE ISOFORM X1 [Salix koriyanagi]|uniref:B-like cyclin n=1 Tax=Salix koriyanagi TaxID=2511006 RepID=A0A9Q0WQC1_9ROSI|nr:CYCLIN-T1-4-LIKE ISOFORM X1 [Salix koriyanagi]